MTDDFPSTPNSVLSRWDRRQRYLLYVAAIFDGGFGIPVFLFPKGTVELLHLPSPETTAIWLRLDGIFLVVLALIYLVTARDPQRYLGNVLVAILGKVVSVVFYITYFFYIVYWVPSVPDTPYFLLVLALLDVIMGVLHTWFIGPDKRAKIQAALRSARAVD